MIPLSYNIRSLAVRKTTTVATAFGIGLVVFVLSASQMLANGVERTLGKAGDPSHAFVMRKGADAELASAIETRIVNVILSAPGVKKDASGAPMGVGEIVIVLALNKADNPDQVSNVQMRGIPDNGLKFRDEIHIIDGRPANPGADEVIIGRRMRGKFVGLELGQSFEIKKNRRVKVVGIFEANGSSYESEILGDVETVRTSFGREGIVSSVTVALESPDAFKKFKAAMESDKQLGLNAMTEPDYYEKQSEGTAGLISFLGKAIVFFFSIGAMIGATITMYAAVAHRKREVGTLRALGFPRSTILLSFVLESTVLALVGGTVGAFASLAMGLVHFSMVNMKSWSEITFSFDPSPGIIASGVILGALLGIIGGLFPAVRASRISPVEAMRD
jgi:putative ABC transport system permease protein